MEVSEQLLKFRGVGAGDQFHVPQGVRQAGETHHSARIIPHPTGETRSVEVANGPSSTERMPTACPWEPHVRRYSQRPFEHGTDAHGLPVGASRSSLPTAASAAYFFSPLAGGEVS